MSKKIISEDLKRFRLLLEYDFYVPEAYEEIAGDGLMAEEDPTDDDDAIGNAPVGDESGDDSFGDTPEEGGDDMGDASDAPMDDMGGEEEGPIDFSGDGGDDVAPEADPMADMPPAAPAEDEVELDVTQLVQGTEEAKASSDQANQQLGQLMQKFDAIEAKLSHIDGITQKIDSLEHEIEKRNPTEQEKLEMRSLASYPYNLKLTDYWADKEGQYDVMNNNGQREPKEFVLTQDDVDSDYNQNAVKDTFDFDEEDI